MLLNNDPANDKIRIFGIFPNVDAIKKVIHLTWLKPQMRLTTGAGIMGIKRQVRMAIKEFRFKKSSYSKTFGYLVNVSSAQSRKPYLLKKKNPIVPTIEPANEIKTPWVTPNTAPITPAKTGNGMTGKKTQMATNSMLMKIDKVPPYFTS